MRLNEKHRKIAVLFASGMLKKQIAEVVGVHPNTVTRTLKNPLVKEIIDNMQKTVQEKTVANLVDAFDKSALEAFQKLVSLMREGRDNTALRASESILDRSTIAPKRQIHTKQEVGGQVMHVHIPARQLRYMHEVMLEAVDDPSKVPELPPIADDEEMLVEVDHRGDVLSEKIIKCTDDT
jgi:IS30 family transposase